MFREAFMSFRPPEGSPEAVEWQRQEEALLGHAKLLGKLYDLGIAQVIEEEVGLPFPQLQVQQGENQPPKANLTGVMLAAGQIKEGEWGYSLIPKKQADGSYGPDLQIRLIRFYEKERLSRYSRKMGQKRVTIEFTKGEKLTVQGEKVAFEGLLNEVSDETIQEAKDSIHRAFSAPSDRLIPGVQAQL